MAMLFKYGLRSVMVPTRRIYTSRLCSINVPNSKLESNKDEPLNFTRSQASSWKARHSRGGDDDNIPWYQGLVVSLSVATFLIYFCVFREENDIDEELGKSLYDRIQGLEESQLKMSLNYNKEHGLDTREIEQRLKEIEETES